MTTRAQADGSSVFTLDTAGGLAAASLGPGRLEVGGTGVRLVETAFHLEEGPDSLWLGAYRLLARGALLGYARVRPPSDLRVDEGAAMVSWEPFDGHPAHLTLRTRVIDDATVDTTVEVTSESTLVDYEVLLASYFTAWHVPEFATRRVWLQPDERPTWLTKTGREFEPTTWARDGSAAQLLLDGRYDHGHPPAWWTIGPHYHAPLMLQQHQRVAHSVVTMGRPDGCFAISGSVDYHNSQYLHLFGRTLEAGETVTTTARLVVLRDADDVHAAAEEAYTRFVGG